MSLNKLLNEAAMSSQSTPHPMRFFRAKQYDMFYSDPSGSGGKIRVSRDSTTKQLIDGGVVMKRRLADLNVHSPREEFDWRVSVSTEDPGG